MFNLDLSVHALWWAP